MKKLAILIAITALFLIATPVTANEITVSYGTIGDGATVTEGCSTVELYTPTGLTGSSYVRLEIPGGIALNQIMSLSYTAKITELGPPFGIYDSFAPEVVLNIDADDADGLEGTGIDWMLSSYDPNELNGDNFLSGDYWPADLASPDTDFVNRDALTHYYFWSANDTRNGLSPTLWTPWASISYPVHGIDSTDLVYSIDFVVGTSGNFDGMRALFSEVELNRTTYPVISGPPTKACVLIESGVPGNGLENAPGLQKSFNPRSQAGKHAGKKD